MAIHRRKFLSKAFIGFLSAGFIPPAVSLLKNHDISSFSIGELFAQLSFKKVTLSLNQIAGKFSLTENSSAGINNTGRILCSGKTVCIQEINNFNCGNKEGIVSVHHETLNGYRRVVSLNHWELLALQKMMTCLKNEHGISDANQLRELLIPVLKTRRQHSNGKFIEGDCSSRYGYYTDFGYCSIRMLAKGKSMKISTSLLDHQMKEIYQNSFDVPTLV